MIVTDLRISQRKLATSIGGNQRTLSVEFSAIEFNIMLAYPTIRGPFALWVDIENSEPTGLLNLPLYAGIDVYTINGATSVSDRKTLAFVGNDERITIGPSSVPQLGAIVGDVTKIVVNIYSFAPLVEQDVYVSIRVDTPLLSIGPPPYVGKDLAAYDTSVFAPSLSVDQSIAANSTDTIVYLQTVPDPLRYKLKSIDIVVAPTAYAGDIQARGLVIDRAGNEFAVLYAYSAQNEYVMQRYEGYIFAPNDYAIAIRADNVNSARAYNVRGTVLIEEHI